MSNENVRMYQQYLEEAQERQIQLQIWDAPWRKLDNFRKKHSSALLTTTKFSTV